MSDFPVDDATLDLVEEALATSVTGRDDDGNFTYSGEFTMGALLNFLSGRDDTGNRVVDEPEHGIATVDVATPLYTRDSIIAALITEVRRLRAAQ